MIRRLIATIGVAAIVMLLIAAPAMAQVTTTVTFRHDDSRRLTPRAGSDATGTWTVTADASSSSYLQSFTVALRIDPAEDHVPTLGSGTTSIGRQYPNTQTKNDTIALTWDTRSLTPYNGVYNVISFAKSYLSDETVSRLVDSIYVNNAPGAPRNVSASLNSNDDPVVSWSANSEPDLIAYRLYRSVGSGSFTQIASVGTGTRSYVDSSNLPKGESIRYEVVAVRHSPRTSSGIASSPTRSSAVTIPVPPPAASPSSGTYNPQGDDPIADGRYQAANGGTSTTSERSIQTSGAPGLAPIEKQTAGDVRIGPRVAPRRDVGFDPLLPYGAEPPQEFIEEEGAVERVLTAPMDFVADRVPTPRFMAAALAMIVVSLHLLRASRRLLAS